MADDNRKSPDKKYAARSVSIVLQAAGVVVAVEYRKVQ